MVYQLSTSLRLEFGGGLHQGVRGLRFFRSTLSGLRVVGFYYLCVEVSYVTDWLEFAVEEPSSCSKRWSTWMVVVLCTLATLITRRLQLIWSLSNVGRTHFRVWSEGFSYSGGGMRLPATEENEVNSTFKWLPSGTRRCGGG
ncbi:hypothetical protein F2Q69_00036083 [Brassica cretica]|uniref:Uncharacterized protein n=1 Tax=Brassica cretica TaxID=69181 RepID=A0A8S9SKI1_BRACR|nr:hypothetical protein F2Q69_00036083 [Brassica cretica]